MEAGPDKRGNPIPFKKAACPHGTNPPSLYLTRNPYGTSVEDNALRMVEEAEYYMYDNGYPRTVRIHGDLARIECPFEYLKGS
jgi:PP-loop superfamily ATP-utilizing enzyme